MMEGLLHREKEMSILASRPDTKNEEINDLKGKLREL
jgi:hypothetical protein